MLYYKFIIIITYKSKAEIDGGSAINSNSSGGSFGTNIASCTCFNSSCCLSWVAVDTLFVSLGGKVGSCAKVGKNNMNIYFNYYYLPVII